MKMTALDGIVGNYGPNWTEGVLTEHIGRLAEAGLGTIVDADGSVHVYDSDTDEAVLLVCSELVEIQTEDGRIIGRCGKAAIRNESVGEWIWCSTHDMPDWGKTCQHGMSAALCAGPGHYPMD